MGKVFALSMEEIKYEGEQLETIYIPGNDADFVVFIQGLRDKAALKSIDGKFRWLVEREDGSKYIARPQSAHE